MSSSTNGTISLDPGGGARWVDLLDDTQQGTVIDLTQQAEDEEGFGDLFPPSVTDILSHTNYFGLLLVFIPIITILGNLLVIVSVLRFRALHSAINFLILGLAVADLLVALFVMPYAVYVHVQNGEWFLGNLMCDIYMASDVACSTASILLLAVISFDRYRAVSRPIQYSRQAQNIKRVFVILVIIWMISVLVASPMVLGMNTRPANANPLECRFYNAAFSIGSSIISFVIPCVLVLFVYIRIMLALKKREQAAKMRRISQLQQHSTTSSVRQTGSGEEEEAGRIVAGPAVNVMMLALPSMSRRMRRYERHQKAIQQAGRCPARRLRDSRRKGRRRSSSSRRFDDDDDVMDEIEMELLEGETRADDEGLEGLEGDGRLWHTRESLHAHPPTSPRSFHSPSRSPLHNISSTATVPLPLVALPSLLNEKDIGGQQEQTSSTPRSSMDSLDEDNHVVTNDFVSDVYTNISRHSSDFHDSSGTQSGESAEKKARRSPRRFQNLARNYSIRLRRKSVSEDGLNSTKRQMAGSFSLSAKSELIPTIIRQLSMRSPRIFRSSKLAKNSPVILSNPSATAKSESNGMDKMTDSHHISILDSEPLTGIKEGNKKNQSEGVQNTSFSRSTTVNSELLGSPEALDESIKNPFIIENKTATKQDASTSDESQPTVTFSMTVRAKAASPSQPEEDTRLKECYDERRRRSEDIVRILTRNVHTDKKGHHPPQLPRLDSMLSTSEKSRSRNNSLKSVDSRNQSVKKLVVVMISQMVVTEMVQIKSQQYKSNGGLAQRLVKKTIKHEQSLKRKVSKNQRKEKRATKTLGIVVGIFLICWVPFFTINILNAVCDVLNKQSCQVGFGPFFYSTWVGYMNSFMNPIIYTIFNTEFRRAFKSLIFGRNSRHGFHQRGQRGANV